jgi:hypothetical protein
MPAISKWGWSTLLTATIFAAACENDRSFEPGPSDSGPFSASRCLGTCILVSGDSPLAAAQYRADSADYPVFLAEVLVHGAPGSVLSLGMTASDGLREAFRNEGTVVVTIGDHDRRTVPLAELSEPVNLFRFETEDTVRVRYFLARNLQRYPTGDFELVQSLNRGSVLASQRPYVRVMAPDFALLPIGDCAVGASDFASVCGILVNIFPWATADHFNATFQSDPGSGPSSTIFVNFALPVKSVITTIYDPTWAGNEMVARDRNGLEIGRVSFSYTGEPGNNIPNTQSIAVPGIRRIDLIPSTGGPDGDYVAYDMNIVPDSSCEPKWSDPWLRDPTVQDGLNSQWQAEWDKGFDRVEPGGWIFQDQSNGTYELVPGDITYQDQCWIDMVPTPPVIPGKVPIATWHGHILTPGLPQPSGCRNAKPGATMANEPSIYDMKFPQRSGYPDYIIDENQLFKVNTNESWDAMPWTKANYCRP